MIREDWGREGKKRSLGKNAVVIAVCSFYKFRKMNNEDISS
jgi:hypothetical protein